MLPTQYHFCTYFDSNYLTRGLVLYRSLARHCQHPFILWVLCFDSVTFQTLDHLHLPGVNLISLDQFEASDLELQKTKTERSLVEYFWTCTPSLPLYVLNHNPEVDLITYLDADLCFYADPMPIYSEMGECSILIIEHRYPPELKYLESSAGVYNVGLLAFRRDDRGLACLHWWRDRCLEWCFTRFEDGKFGDQKYLDDWTLRFDGVVVLQQKGAGLAPWNAIQYLIQWNEGRFTLDDFPLIFYHFHGFKNVARNVVQPTEHCYRLSPLLIEHLYFPYVYALQEVERELRLSKSKGLLERNTGTPMLLPGLLEQRWLLITSKKLGLALWKLGESQHNRLLDGPDAYRLGDLKSARRICFLAVLRNPFVLEDRPILSILARTTLTPGQISFFQRLSGRGGRQLDKKTAYATENQYNNSKL
jgi:hypothetical protein